MTNRAGLDLNGTDLSKTPSLLAIRKPNHPQPMKNTHIAPPPAGQSRLPDSKQPQSPPLRHSWRSRGLRLAAKTAACCAALLLACALAVPAQAAPLTYNFDDGTLQGWTTVSSDPGNSPDPRTMLRCRLATGISPQGGQNSSCAIHQAIATMRTSRSGSARPSLSSTKPAP